MGKVNLLGKVGKVGKVEILVVLRKILIFSKVVFGNYTAFVVDCTAFVAAFVYFRSG